MQVDQHILTQIIDTAEAILWNDGMEEYPAELVAFAREAIGVPEPQQPEARIIKAATHAAFGAMLLGLPLKTAVNIVVANRGDILEGIETKAVECVNQSCPQNDGDICLPGRSECQRRSTRPKTLWWVDLCTITVKASSREEALEEGLSRIRIGEATIDTVQDTGEEAEE
jgi:hypothetical protein